MARNFMQREHEKHTLQATALDELSDADPRKAKVVELRYFGGLRGDGLHDLAVAERAGLGGVRRNVLQNRGQLGQHQFRGHAIHARQAHGVQIGRASCRERV